MNKWKIKDKIVLFPSDWDKDKVLKWCNNNGAIRLCPNCGKLDVSYDHFNSCNPASERVRQSNQAMNDNYLWN